ncbi:class I SAM-dependent methyltransferase [Aliarcobacter cryaerophilus]|uniref:Methyltransferase type 11 domain-containing protein n=1 Tax=Aliarcobacter cryaerophilus TaxID=28198 RepID=A0A2S9SQ00_9BACT|nr:class I SAM-dependent methyltransferase [Aliarcobacter cryaerophilus]MCT7505772.1 methyltransferase domain-containing protein [Aliarcobacter cryaerophilus]PRM88660.1 hypothetical protein CJ669_03245 [Aliarcobacter cryaerophilus]
MNNNFYKAFEDRHRGSRELIKSRLKFYLPFLDKLKDIKDEQILALDIGCGRGEWLELLKENNIKSKGIDQDKDMLEASKELNLDVELGDGIKYLVLQEPSSLDIISAFHVVEHISFEELKILVKEAFRVLKPAGLLILETPNCENIFVSSYSFYLDPTHTKPIPSELLSFITEFAGFTQNKTVRLQEPEYIKQKEFVSLSEVITSVSPDYAIIAQKPATKEELEKFNSLFKADYGLSLSQITKKFNDKSLNIDYEINSIKNILDTLNNKLNDSEKKTTQAQEQILSLLNSHSWKITAPLRAFKNFLTWFKTGFLSWITFAPGSRPRRVLKKIIKSLIIFVDTNKLIKKVLINSAKFLKIYGFLRRFYNKLKDKDIASNAISEKYPLKFEDLSSLAKEIYKDIDIKK